MSKQDVFERKLVGNARAGWKMILSENSKNTASYRIPEHLDACVTKG